MSIDKQKDVGTEASSCTDLLLQHEDILHSGFENVDGRHGHVPSTSGQGLHHRLLL